MQLSPNLKLYLATVAVLALNLLFLSIWTLLKRTKVKTYVYPEDAKLLKGEAAVSEEASVERVRRAQLNALESIVPFMALAWCYLQVEPPVLYLRIYCYVFVLARLAHTFCHLRGIQPLRSVFFAIGWLANLGLAVQLLMAAFS